MHRCLEYITVSSTVLNYVTAAHEFHNCNSYNVNTWAIYKCPIDEDAYNNVNSFEVIYGFFTRSSNIFFYCDISYQFQYLM